MNRPALQQALTALGKAVLALAESLDEGRPIRTSMRDVPDPDDMRPGGAPSPEPPRPRKRNRRKPGVDPAVSAARSAAASASHRARAARTRLLPPDGQQSGSKRAANGQQNPPAPPFCTSDAVGRSAPSGSPGARAFAATEMAAKWPANGAAKAAEPRTSSRACEEEFRARREAIAKALDASPLESKLKWQAPAYRARDIGLWSHELATAGFDRAGVQKLIALDAEKANEPGALLGRWLRRGAGHCRDVIGEPGMKDRQAVGVQRMLDFDAARPADQVARGEPAGFGVTPLLAGSVLASAVLRLAHGGST